MENQNDTNRPATPAEPAADGIRDTMETAAEWLEARLNEAEKEAEAMPPDELAALLRSTSDYHHELAESADEDSAQACRVQAAAIWRAADELGKLAKVEAALDSLTDEEVEWDAGTLSDFVAELHGILKGGLR